MKFIEANLLGQCHKYIQLCTVYICSMTWNCIILSLKMKLQSSKMARGLGCFGLVVMDLKHLKECFRSYVQY